MRDGGGGGATSGKNLRSFQKLLGSLGPGRPLVPGMEDVTWSMKSEHLQPDFNFKVALGYDPAQYNIIPSRRQFALRKGFWSRGAGRVAVAGLRIIWHRSPGRCGRGYGEKCPASHPHLWGSQDTPPPRDPALFSRGGGESLPPWEDIDGQCFSPSPSLCPHSS